MAHRSSIAIFFLLALPALLALSPAPASATVYTWTGSVLTTSWSNSGNWLNVSSPGQNDTAQFPYPSATYVGQPSTDTPGDTVGAVWDNGSGSVTIGGAGALTITGTAVNGNATTGVELDFGAGSLTINCPITLGANQQWINNSANPITVFSTINGNSKNMTLNTVGSGSLVLAGSVGSMALTGSNYFGNVTLTGTATPGTVLFLGYSGSTTAGAATTTNIAAGGLLNITSNGTIAIANNVVVNGGTIQSAASSGTAGIGFVASQGGSLTVSNGLVNFGNQVVNFGRGAKGFLNLNGGTYIMNAAPQVATNGGTMNFNGGTLQLGGNIAAFAPNTLGLNVGNGGANINLNGFSTTISGSLANSGGTSSGGLTLNTTTGGSLTLSGTNTYTGVTLLNGGTLLLANTAALLNSTFDTSSAGTLAFGNLTAATFGGLKGTAGTLNLMNNAVTPVNVALTAGNNGSNTTFNGTLTGGGTLTKIGSGVLTFASSTSNYTGATNINAGALEYSNTAAMPGTSTINVASGAVLGAAVGGANPFIFGGSGPGTTGGLLAGAGPSGNVINWAANSMLGIDTTGGSLAVSGYSSGTVGLAKLGSGTMAMSGTNSYSGPTKLFAGTLDINGPFAIGTGTLALAGGVIDNTSGGPVTLGNVPQVWSNNFSFGGSNFLNLGTGPVTTTQQLTVTTSAGTLEVDGNISTTFELLTAGAAGTLLLTGSDTIVAGGNVASIGNNLVSTGTLTFTGSGNLITLAGSTFTIAGGLTTNTGLGNSVGTVLGNNAGSPTNMIVSGGTFAETGGSLTLGQKSNGILTIQNTGLVALGTTVALNFDFQNQAGGLGTLNLNGGTLQSIGFVSGVAGEKVNFNGGLLQLTNSSSNLFGANPANFTANVGNGGAVINLNGKSTTISNSLLNSGGTSSGGLTVFATSPGTLTLTGTSTYTGPTTVLGGTLIVSNSAVSTAASILPQNGSLTVSNAKVSLAGNQSSSYGIYDTAAGTVTLNSGGVLSADQTQNNTTNLYTLAMNGGTLAATQLPAINNQHFTINNQIFATGPAPSLISANIGDMGGGLTVDVAAGSQLTLSGQLADSGPVSLVKVNSGALVITSSQSSYTGATTVSGGTLAVDATGANTGALGATAVNVAGGATFLARGNTSIASGGSLGVAGGGAIDLRDAQVNTLTVNGNLSLGTGGQGSNVYLELGTGTADLVNITGAASVTGTSSVNISLATGASVLSGTYDLISAASGLTAGNFKVGLKPAGFNSYTLSTPTPGALLLSITGNPAPATAYWTGLASTDLANSANQWGIGSTIGTSNWSTTPDGLTDPEQVPGSITDVYFTAANAVGNGAGNLTTTLDTNYSINSLNFAVESGTITSVAINTAGNSMTIGAGGLVLASTSNASVSIGGSGSVIVNGSQNWANNSNQPLVVSAPIAAFSGQTALIINGTGSGGATLGGIIGDGVSGGTLGLVLNQAGTVTVGGTAANTYSGGTTISSGLVRLMGAGALGSSAGALTANGGSLDVNGNSVTASGLSGAAGTIYNNAGSGVATLTIGAAGGSFSGSISDTGGVPGGAVALVVSSTSAFALSGTNTYSGGTTVSAGTLDINSNSAIGSGTLSLAGGNIDNTSGHPVTLGNIPQVWSNNFTFRGSNYLNLGTGAVTNTSGRTITLSAGTLEIDGNITSAFPVSTSGNGTLVLGGSNSITAYSANVFTAFSNLTSTGTTSLVGGPFVTGAGTTFTVASGLFTVSSSAANLPATALGNNGSSASPPATMLVSGGTFSQPTGNLAVAQHSPGVLTINSGLVSLANALEFTVPAGTAPATVNLNGGQLDLPVITVVGTSSGDLFNFNGGLLQLSASSANLITQNSNFAIVTMNVGDGGAAIDLNGHATTITNALQATGSGGLTVYSSTPGGKLTLTAANLYAGNTTINGGIIVPANDMAFSSGTVTVNPSGQIDCISAQNIANPLVLSGTGANGAALEQGGGQATTYTGLVSLAGNTTTHTDGSAGLTVAGQLALNGNTLRINGDGGSSTTISGNIAADSGALVCNAPGLTLSGSNGYTGGTTVVGGSLILGSSAAIGPGALAANGGVVNLNGFGATVTSFSGAAGTVTNSNSSAAPAMLTVNQSITTTFSGLLRDGTNQLGLTLGGGTLTLSGTNTYTGGTYVEGGTLIAANPTAIEDGTNLFVGDASELLQLGSVVPAQAGSLASGASAASAVAAVPEPQTLALLAAAGTCLLLSRRRR